MEILSRLVSKQVNYLTMLRQEDGNYEIIITFTHMLYKLLIVSNSAVTASVINDCRFGNTQSYG